jgi:hypothetical protein
LKELWINPQRAWIECHYPFHDLPKLPPYEAQVLSWWSTDSEENFQRNGGHPVYGKDDISYSFNKHGYRCFEFKTIEQGLKVLSAGCSYVFGVGLPVHDIFHEKISCYLQKVINVNVVNINLGYSGCSNDFIARLLFLAVPLFDPDVVIVNFTHACRRDYLLSDGAWCPYTPSFRPPDSVRSIYRNFDKLCSDADDCLNVFRNYKAIEGFLRERIFLFSAIEPSFADILGEHLDRSRFVGTLTYFDFARDHKHPGQASHAHLAGRYIEAMESTALLETLKKRKA